MKITFSIFKMEASMYNNSTRKFEAELAADGFENHDAATDFIKRFLSLGSYIILPIYQKCER